MCITTESKSTFENSLDWNINDTIKTSFKEYLVNAKHSPLKSYLETVYVRGREALMSSLLTATEKYLKNNPVVFSPISMLQILSTYNAVSKKNSGTWKELNSFINHHAMHSLKEYLKKYVSNNVLTNNYIGNLECQRSITLFKSFTTAILPFQSRLIKSHEDLISKLQRVSQNKIHAQPSQNMKNMETWSIFAMKLKWHQEAKKVELSENSKKLLGLNVGKSEMYVHHKLRTISHNTEDFYVLKVELDSEKYFHSSQNHIPARNVLFSAYFIEEKRKMPFEELWAKMRKGIFLQNDLRKVNFWMPRFKVQSNIQLSEKDFPHLFNNKNRDFPFFQSPVQLSFNQIVEVCMDEYGIRAMSRSSNLDGTNPITPQSSVNSNKKFVISDISGIPIFVGDVVNELDASESCQDFQT
ncbi:hypothetical protein HMI54_003368 [Coelomomyces lativittatus]|nr:hypothetical protein HMI56_002507 [Coelomomyces lativittatus]KAJ1517298.1 hypothetical protein HMI55_000130 [Coelomomyces lativittatus]KAJ1517921.1 hypothetical protein HMI54_003368 [Coelomomyces lativittatus]